MTNDEIPNVEEMSNVEARMTKDHSRQLSAVSFWLKADR